VPEQDKKYGEFSLSQARTIVGEFFTPNPWIFWTDFLISWSLGMSAFLLVQYPEVVASDPAWHWPVRIVCFFVSAFLYYRCALFIHELMHIRDGEFTAFRFVWNMLCGIPFLVPTFVYYTHADHHRRKLYGTKKDGEYISLTSMPPSKILLYMSQIFVAFPFAVIRFGLLTPLTWVSRPLRDWVHRHASSMIMNPAYLRPLPTPRTLRTIRLQEFFCFLWIVFITLRMFAPFGLLPGTLPLSFLLQAYLTGVFIVLLNNLRTLGAHRWVSVGKEMTFIEQLVDSVNYPKHPITSGLWAPVGLRFHALHHVFPTMPYHALPTAHRRLIRDLPEDSPYRLCCANSLPEVLLDLWRTAKASQKSIR